MCGVSVMMCGCHGTTMSVVCGDELYFYAGDTTHIGTTKDSFRWDVHSAERVG